MYSIQSLGQLTLFVGHGRAQDKTSHLLSISLSYLQLAVGSSVSVLSLNPNTYMKWTDSCWLPSFWTFLHRMQIQVDVHKHRTPTPQRCHDLVLMDYFVDLGYSATTLGTLNCCRLYLQVNTLSDIVTANGLSILLEALHGIPLTDRVSSLEWPSQQRPPHKIMGNLDICLANITAQEHSTHTAGLMDYASVTSILELVPQCS